MRLSRASIGSVVAGISAVVLLIDVRQPWYSLHLPAPFPGVGTAELTPPDFLIDQAISAVAIAVLTLAVIGQTRDLAVVQGRALATLGGVVFGIVAYRALEPPGSLAAYLSPGRGIWIGLTAAVIIFAGGTMRSRTRL